MKLISKEYKMLGNAVNYHLTTYRIRIYAVEDDDVGKTWDNYLGERYASHTFRKKDVGRQVIEYFREGKNNYHRHIVEQFWQFRQNT